MPRSLTKQELEQSEKAAARRARIALKMRPPTKSDIIRAAKWEARLEEEEAARDEKARAERER